MHPQSLLVHGKHKFASALESQRGPRSMQSVVDAFTSALARDGYHACGHACGFLRDGSSYRKHAPSSMLST